MLSLHTRMNGWKTGRMEWKVERVAGEGDESGRDEEKKRPNSDDKIVKVD